MWAILISFLMVLGFLISAFLVSLSWKFYEKDWTGLKLNCLRSKNVLSRVWPTDNKFMSLDYSMIRHLVIGIISVVIMYIFSNGFFAKLMPVLNLIYALIKWIAVIYLLFERKVAKIRKKPLISATFLSNLNLINCVENNCITNLLQMKRHAPKRGPACLYRVLYSACICLIQAL